jgi:hypothetical protein
LSGSAGGIADEGIEALLRRSGVPSPVSAEASVDCTSEDLLGQRVRFGRVRAFQVIEPLTQQLDCARICSGASHEELERVKIPTCLCKQRR